ncbi:hypothetical protein [Phenylobacterium sp.]|uniref:hypothetical protein n=1 Tax=Phenylobacterium sp. TaxID=1871053 RepID=UPI0028110AB3|nr:hypothetical protein [Phenylobacterium sp.]
MAAEPGGLAEAIVRALGCSPELAAAVAARAAARDYPARAVILRWGEPMGPRLAGGGGRTHALA